YSSLGNSGYIAHRKMGDAGVVGVRGHSTAEIRERDVYSPVNNHQCSSGLINFPSHLFVIMVYNCAD
ncbi:MAG: hypothetical protein MI867_15730, partial [Pseudomonadales bacterium]|nr:hypothetical protein [Pseudomonadales bacterium]